jgi:tRNA pseudouridine55 synthase
VTPFPGQLDGLVVVDKEQGWTSHDVVARCRRLLGTRRVGHAGTLDPAATGVLLVGVGSATRLLRFAASGPKRYQGEVVLGVATSTLDAGGQVTGRWDMGGLTLADVRQAAAGLTGEIQQVPPMVSALKVGGRRLHELARAGVEVERPPRAVTVHHFDVAPTGEEGVYSIEVVCSSGTYVRSLAADLGAALGGGAHLRSLRRTAVGSFGEAEAIKVDEVTPSRVMPLGEAVRDLAGMSVEEELGSAVAHGAVLEPGVVGLGGTGPWAIFDQEGALLAVYERCGGRVKPVVVLAH